MSTKEHAAPQIVIRGKKWAALDECARNRAAIEQAMVDDSFVRDFQRAVKATMVPAARSLIDMRSPWQQYVEIARQLDDVTRNVRDVWTGPAMLPAAYANPLTRAVHRRVAKARQQNVQAMQGRDVLRRGIQGSVVVMIATMLVMAFFPLVAGVGIGLVLLMLGATTLLDASVRQRYVLDPRVATLLIIAGAGIVVLATAAIAT
jgi:hypothetical protein